MTIFGHVDGFEGMFVAGWAFSTVSDQSCIIELHDERGRLVGKGRASRFRADLSGHSREPDFAFLVSVNLVGDEKAISVHADGVELVNSPVNFSDGNYDGSVHVTGTRLTGWVQRRSTLIEPIALDFFGPGEDFLGTAHAAPHQGGDPRCYFDFALPDRVFGSIDYRIKVNAGAILFRTVRVGFPLEGYIDHISCDRIAGWLLSQADVHRSISVELWVDGSLISTTKCNVRRDDLLEKYPGVVAPGFDIFFGGSIQSGSNAVVVELRVEGGTPVLGSPYLVGTRDSFLGAARAAARLSLDLSLPVAQRTIIQAALNEKISAIRAGDVPRPMSCVPDYKSVQAAGRRAVAPRLTVLIPIYKNLEVTRSCVESVLRQINVDSDEIVLINDRSPDEGMVSMLAEFAGYATVRVVSNAVNVGFVKTVNTGLRLISGGDVLLLNSDTVLFEGGIEELHRLSLNDNSIGTITAISNNATIFSYPSPRMPKERLEDISWEDLARIALSVNRGVVVPVPTGHGFCMYIRRQMLRLVPELDEQFGRGYGEENAMCLRAEDYGFRHVAAGGVFVQHLESVSFGHDARLEQIANNMPLLNQMYPEYQASVMDFEATDGLRVARRGLDFARLRRRGVSGKGFVVSIEHSYGGGSAKAADAILSVLRTPTDQIIRISLGGDGIRLCCMTPVIDAFFLHSEISELVDLLENTEIDLVLVHAFIGINYLEIDQLGAFIRAHRSIIFLHDFYGICPRVTLIDAVQKFCSASNNSVCFRCVKLGGVHEFAAKLNITDDLGDETLSHRGKMYPFLKSACRVFAPSKSTVKYFEKIFPDLDVQVLPHLEENASFPNKVRSSDPLAYLNIVIIGAIGPHKGAKDLLELAKTAFITHQDLHFHVIGYTSMDAELLKIGNVSISGKYDASDFLDIVKSTGSGISLFLNRWAETYSYTLTEAVQAGLFPVVPDIGAPAERVRAAKFGAVFPFPFEPKDILALLDALRQKQVLDSLISPNGFDDQRTALDYARAIGLLGEIGH